MTTLPKLIWSFIWKTLIEKEANTFYVGLEVVSTKKIPTWKVVKYKSSFGVCMFTLENNTVHWNIPAIYAIWNSQQWMAWRTTFQRSIMWWLQGYDLVNVHIAIRKWNMQATYKLISEPFTELICPKSVPHVNLWHTQAPNWEDMSALCIFGNQRSVHLVILKQRIQRRWRSTEWINMTKSSFADTAVTKQRKPITFEGTSWPTLMLLIICVTNVTSGRRRHNLWKHTVSTTSLQNIFVTSANTHHSTVLTLQLTRKQNMVVRNTNVTCVDRYSNT